MKTIRYFQAGFLLHLMAVFSIFMVYVFGKGFLILLKNDENLLKLLLFGGAGIYFFTLFFFSQLDARSRYQNYKMVKDKLYTYGFDRRLLKPFIYSRCQREAIAVAVRELEFGREWKKLTCQYGFRWYHLLPTIVTRNPLILFTRSYWSKTLFVKTYHAKYFLW